MTDAIHLLIEKSGLFAVFIGCVAEGESAAILAGFLAGWYAAHYFSRHVRGD